LKLNPDVVVTLDGDGQHDPDEIPVLLKPIEAGESDVVVGSRYVDGGKTNAPLYRRFGLRVINFLFKKVAGVKISDTQSGFRAYTQKAFRYMMNYTAKGYGVEGEQLAMAAKNGLRVTEVPVSVNYRGSMPTSKMSPLLHGVDLLSTLFRLVLEEKPLTYLGVPGMGLIIVGIFLGNYLLWTLNETQSISIPLSIAAMGLLIGGLLLVFSAITLHGLKKINEKLSQLKE
jgi:glycosyltransferase involved in cell wall biosynthesis